MLEIESKLFFPGVSAREVEQALTSAGVDLGPAVHQCDRVFAASRDAVLNPVPGTTVSRVRSSDQGMSLTVKVRQDRDLSRSEVEVGVDDPDAAEGVLIALGQQHVVTVDKVRVSGHLDGATVTVDDVIGLGTFVECEILTDETSASPATRLDALTATIGQHVGMVGERIDKGYDRLLLERGSAAL